MLSLMLLEEIVGGGGEEEGKLFVQHKLLGLVCIVTD